MSSKRLLGVGARLALVASLGWAGSSLGQGGAAPPEPAEPLAPGATGPAVPDAAAVAAGPRLSRDVLPIFQYIELELDPDATDYTGRVRIELEVKQAVEGLRFHAEDIELDSVRITGPSGPQELECTAGELGVVTARGPRPLVSGRYVLSISFHNDFGTRAVGLYRMDVEGRGYVFTQFEAVDARKAFPCWDEPSFKLPYRMRLIVPGEHQAITNTAIESTEELADGRKSILYRTTDSLPSYLLAIGVGPLESIPIPGLDVPGSIYTVAGKAHLAALGAEMTAPILKALEAYFGQPYPFAKLDYLAVPEFWPGAMENAGAITYAEPILLLDPDHTSFAQRRYLAMVIAHELAHQWFGNLVTMDWWDDLWLNESFAYWMGEMIPDRVFPELRFQITSVRETAAAMGADAQLSSRAVRTPVTDPANLLQTSNVLTNHKGKAVIGMIEAWLGRDTFRDGVRSYMAEHAWRNARGDDLWTALAAVSGEDVGAVMATFLDQPGLPVVTVELVEPGQVRLSQSRFLHHGAVAPAPQRWKIPVRMRYAVDGETHTQSVRLEAAEMRVALAAEGAVAWIHPNAAEVGYYRWRVAPELLAELTGQARSELEVRERVALAGHLAALLDSGDLSGMDYLEHLGRFADDEDPSVVDAMLRGLDKVEMAFVTEDLVEPFAAYVRTRLRPALDRFGMQAAPGEMEAVALVRPDLMRWLGDRGQDEEVLAHAGKLAKTYLEDPGAVDPALASTALRLAAIDGDRELFDACRRRFEAAAVPGERHRFLSAMGSLRDRELVDLALAYSLEGPLRPQELMTIPMAVGAHPPFRDIIWTWMTSHYDAIASRLPPHFVAYLPYAASGCSTELLARAQAFFAEPEHQVPGTETELAKVEEQVESCVELRAREGASVREYLGGTQAEMD